MYFKKKDGFTLVELIVVIAILAILAGIGVPAYSGYIEKAKKAGDLQLLSAVNTAFAAACIDNETYATAFPDGSVKFDTSAMTVSEYNDDFQVYFAGNGTFTEIDQLLFVGGVFVDPTTASGEGSGIVSVNYAGQTLYFTQAQADALANSTFGTVVGAEKLLGEVAALTGWADSDGNAILDVLGDDYYNSLANYMGFDDPQAFQDYLNDAQESGELTAEQIDTIVTNGIVLYAADNFSNLTNEDISTLLNSDNIYSNLSDDPAMQLAQASMVYGLYTGYVNSDYYTGEVVTTTDPVSAIKTVSSDAEFLKYVNSPQGQADLEAYTAAMGVINDSTSNTEAITDVLKNGYDNEELVTLLQQVMGK